MSKRFIVALCLCATFILSALGVFIYHFGDRDLQSVGYSPDGTRVTLVTPSGDRDLIQPNVSQNG